MVYCFGGIKTVNVTGHLRSIVKITWSTASAVLRFYLLKNYYAFY